MFHYTIFAGSEAQMSPKGFTAVTLFGGAELKRPTLAQRVLTLEDEEPSSDGWWTRLTDPSRNTVLTMFGSTELLQPTLMEEYSALRSLISTGVLTPADLQTRLRTLLAREKKQDMTTITLFGAFEDTMPSRKRQLKALAQGEKAGLIPPNHRQRLDEVADAAPANGVEVLGQLVAEMA